MSRNSEAAISAPAQVPLTTRAQYPQFPPVARLHAQQLPKDILSHASLEQAHVVISELLSGRAGADLLYDRGTLGITTHFQQHADTC